MGFSTLIIFVGLTTLTVQKSVKLMDTQESPELEVNLQNLLNQGLYKDVKLKNNPNKKSKSKDVKGLQYIGEISSEKDGKEGLKSLNKKLAKLLDGLQDNVMNENTNNPKCSCGYASNRLPGVIKCQCDSLSHDNDAPNHAEDIVESMREKHTVDHISPADNKNEKHQDRRKIRSVKGKQDKHISRFTSDDDINSWSEDNRCGCTRLSDAGDDDNDEMIVRCGCRPAIIARLGKDDDREVGYLTDTESCECKVLRNRGNGIKDLRCRCNSPARLGKDDNREYSYKTDTERCGCNALRNRGNGIKDLRCRCSSRSRAVGHKNSARNGYNPRSDLYSAILSDLSEEDNNYQNKHPRTKSDERNLNILMGLLDKEDNFDLSKLPDKDRNVLLKLKDIMPSLRNIDIEELKDNIETMLNERQYPLRETIYKHKQDEGNPLDNPAQIHRLLQLIEEQKRQKKKKMYRRSMPEETVGVPFTYELEGLAQINT